MSCDWYADQETEKMLKEHEHESNSNKCLTFTDIQIILKAQQKIDSYVNYLTEFIK
jgi:hypothetical protein